MNFAEALTLLNNGKKLKCNAYDTDGEYWIMGFIGFSEPFSDFVSNYDGKSLNKDEYIQNIFNELVVMKCAESRKSKTIHRLDKHGNVIRDKYFNYIPKFILLSDEWEEVQ